MRLVGLDLSLTRTGWAVDADTYGSLIPAKSLGLGVERLDWILRQVLDLAAGADLICIEGYSFGSSQAGTRAIAELGGLVRWGLWRKKVRYVEIPPSNVKKLSTGKGNAGKEEVLAAAIRRLEFAGHSNDEADARWLLEAGLQHYGLSRTELPKSHLEALTKIKWPHLAAVVGT